MDYEKLNLSGPSTPNPNVEVNFRKSSYLTNSFQITYTLLIFSLVTAGMGTHILGYFVFTNVSTLFIYLAFLFQWITGSLRFPKFLLLIFTYIVLQTFIINFNISSIAISFKHFVGILVFSVSIFSFVTVYKNRIVEIIKVYYLFVFFIASIAVLQILLYVFLKISFIPQNFISGTLTALQSNTFEPTILGIFPRAIGLSTEPSHLAMIMLPGVYIALLVLAGKGSEFGVANKTKALIILLGLLLSFSLLGYIGLTLCVLFIFGNQLKRNFLKKALIFIPFIGIIIFSFHSPIGDRITSLIEMLKDIKGYQYTSSDLSGWALVSNIEVAGEGLKKSYYLGTGLNTHKNTYDATIHKIFPKLLVMELNKESAGSMFIRLTSEFGIPGILALILFLFHFRLGRRYKKSPILTVNTMSLVLLITYCARNGDYLTVNFILFSALFYTSYKLVKNDNYSLISN